MSTKFENNNQNKIPYDFEQLKKHNIQMKTIYVEKDIGNLKLMCEGFEGCL